MREDTDTIANAVKRIAEMPAGALISEEDVKNKVVLPIFGALGYEDNDFNYERRTGRGYVDVVVEHFPIGIVVESKAPRTKLDNYREQLEAYVFHKHGQGRTTVAILTDGEKFKLYGISGAFYKGSLEDHRILSFTRSEVVDAGLWSKLLDLLGRQSNQEGMISEAIAAHRKAQEQINAIETELQAVKADRERIDNRIQELESQRTVILGFSDGDRNEPRAASTPSNVYSRPASPHILRLLQEREAVSRSKGIDRKGLKQIKLLVLG